MDPVGAKDPDFKDGELYTDPTSIQVVPNTDASVPASTTAPTGPDTTVAGASTVTPASPSGSSSTGPTPSFINQTEYQKIEIHTKLVYCQRDVYILFRENLGEYMDFTARNLLKAHMERETDERIKDESIRV